MTIVAWDGTTLAADKRAVQAGLIRTLTKIFKVRGYLCAYTHNAGQGEEMLDWFRQGADVSKFPESQRDKDDWSDLLTISPEKIIYKYARNPFPIKFEDKIFAIGSGRA